MSLRKTKIYDKLPFVYEYMMRKVNYKIWSEYLATILNDVVPPNPNVLELAAGNCKLANYFIHCYPNLIVTDLSFNMLSMDKKNHLTKICCDMKSLPFKSKFNLIYSAFDSVNYLTSKKALLKMFSEVNLLLSDSAVFTFDVSLERNSLNHTKVPNRGGTYKGIHFNQNSKYNKKTRIHTNSFKITLNSGEIFTEKHKQKIYPFETYFELLEKAGLYAVKCYKGFTLQDGNSNSPRVQFITKKIKKHA